MQARIAYGLDGIPDRRHVVTIGNFDGVHRGHRYLLQIVSRRAGERGAGSLAITFDPLPAEVLYPERAPKRLTSTDDRLALIAACGIDTVAVLPFSREVASWSAAEFVDRLIHVAHPIEMVVGADFRFGHDRAGTPALLERVGREADFNVTVVERIGGDQISSTQVRSAIVEGNVRRAAELLGRPYRLCGVVAHGAKRGRVLGFPTANLEYDSRLVTPADGIYAAVATIDPGPEVLESLVYVGTRPTFSEAERVVEVYLLDFSEEIYDQTLKVLFLTQIRGDAHFDSIDELIERMKVDEAETRAFLASGAAKAMREAAVDIMGTEGAERVDR